MLYGLKQVEIPIKQISGITHHVGLVLGKIEVASSGTIKVIEAKKEDVGRVAYVISELVSMSSQTSSLSATNLKMTAYPNSRDWQAEGARHNKRRRIYSTKKKILGS